MKTFLTTVKHLANIGLRLFMAVLILASLAMVYPTAIVTLPYVVAGVIVLYFLTYGRRISGLAAVTQADIFNATQLQQKAIVLASIYQHYGWRQDSTGAWVRGDGREIPEFLDKLRITRKDIYQIQYLTIGQDTFKFFSAAQGNGSVFVNNLKEVNLAPNKMVVMFGIVFEAATAASAADTPDILNFITAADEEILNGVVSLRANTLQLLDNTQFKSAFVNDDAVKNYLRFPEAVIWEPGNSIELELKLCKAFGAGIFKFARATVLGFELTK